ncbi:MAG TPA: outer membrane protein assembly factor BamD, partial [Candidatus Acidoferrum sp.]|nr:outer membrane protein assembly factor BamD [Candidatus Acidoferrum sp.]
MRAIATFNPSMIRRLLRLLCVAVALLAFAYNSPAPLIYKPGEGWVYEKPGETAGTWQRTRAKDQLEVAQQAFDQTNFDLALKASRRTVNNWPFSDYAPKAQYLLGRCLEEKGQDQQAFKQYQQLIEKYPKIAEADDVLKRQFEIANRFLGGQWFKLWGYIPMPPSMDKTAEMYEQVIKNGPYSEVGPQAQLNVGTVREKQKDYPAAVKAFERAADRYADKEQVASEALYRAGMAYLKEARTSEYDQTVASKAIATFSDFATLHPDDARVKETGDRIDTLRTEQARGSYDIAQFYEKRKKWNAALIYYNEVLLKDPSSGYADAARIRIDTIKKRNPPA